MRGGGNNDVTFELLEDEGGPDGGRMTEDPSLKPCTPSSTLNNRADLKLCELLLGEYKDIWESLAVTLGLDEVPLNDDGGGWCRYLKVIGLYRVPSPYPVPAGGSIRSQSSSAGLPSPSATFFPLS